jgi:asparagine synthase (glutamine-hydrolysing)
MCGIAGVYSTSLSRSAKAGIAEDMAEALLHRGPDGLETYVDDLVGIAMTRLAIVDRDAEQVLIWNEAADTVIAFNGEIYNYRSLRERLPAHQFRTATDSEVVLHLFEEQGAKSLSVMRGDYAFVIWDRDGQQGVLARDRLGVKPLYFAEVPGGLAFASEVGALTGCFPNLLELDPLAVYDYLYHRFVPGPQTVFRKIRKLPPGGTLSFGREPRPEDSCPAPQVEHQWVDTDLLAAGRHLLTNAVAVRMPQEVPFGILLSGGLDSTLLTAIASSLSEEPVRTFSVVFTKDDADLDSSEHEESRATVECFGTLHRELAVGAADFCGGIEKTISHLGEPLADPPAVLLGLLCEAAAQDVRVLLSGEGADELFAGYSIYRQMLASGGRYEGMGRLMPKDQQEAILSANMKAAISDHRTAPAVLAEELAGQGRADALHQMLAVDRRFWLPDDLLTKADRMGMMSSVEVRVPYLDNELVSFAEAIPSELMLARGQGKAFLRALGRAYLPPLFVARPKRGFPLPLGVWLRGPLSRWVNDVFEGLANREYFESEAVRRLYMNYVGGGASVWQDHIVWALLVLELFLRNVDEALH